ncbi:mitochondrial carrier domain-containing protein [Aspergillus falconensis]
MSSPDGGDTSSAALKMLFCGGVAGIVTWASVFPLDVIKTRLQANTIAAYAEAHPFPQAQTNKQTLGSFALAREMFRTEGFRAFYRGLAVCSLRAFIVNAAQWATYEWLMRYFQNTTWNKSLETL